MKLSKRLLAVADMVTPGSVLADIGTDHAYIPIYLVEKGIIPRALAMDINPGPLARAREHIQEHGLVSLIETRRSDGLAALHPGEAQSVVIAGMGGALTMRILQESGSLPENIREFILQPQSEVPLVRAYLEQNGFQIVREDMVFEAGKYYPMMKTEKRGGSCLLSADNPTERESIPHPLQLAFGPELLRLRHPVLYRHLLHERATQERILESLERSGCNTENVSRSTDTIKRMAEVQNYMHQIDEALTYFHPSKEAGEHERHE